MNALAPSRLRDRLARIVADINLDRSPTPAQIGLIVDHAAIARPVLLEILSDCAARERLPGGPVDAPLHAIFLLAAIDGFDALPLVETILRKSFEDFVDPLFDENLLETVPWALARLGLDQPERLLGLVHDARLSVWVRVSVLQALVAQAALRPDRRAFILERLCAPRPPRRAPADGGGFAEFLDVAVARLRAADDVREEDDIAYFGPIRPDFDIFEVYEKAGRMIGYHDPIWAGDAHDA